MANITIAANANSTVSSTITAPGADIILSDYLALAEKGTAVSIPTTGTGQILTSMGRYSQSDSVWRLRNGVTSAPFANATLTSQGGLFSGRYDLPTGTDTFVVSPIFKTHLSSFGNKAAGSQTFKYGYVLGSSDQYTIKGAAGNDVLTGSASSDTLVGLGGDDTLNGGDGSDRFVFTNQGVDTVTVFEGDVFAIASANYLNAPVAGTPVVAGSVGTESANIFVDSSESLLTASSSNVRFAYDTTTNKFLFDSDGDWSSGNVIIANVSSLTGSLGSTNFAFV